MCLYREIKEDYVDFFGTIMKGLELFSIYFYFGIYIKSLSMFSFWMYNLPVSKMIDYLEINHNLNQIIYFKQPECLQNKSILKEWAGGCFDWMMLEIIIFTTYASTLILLMIKSRFMSVGNDNTH